MRTCYSCLADLPAEEFALDRSKGSGRKSICKACDRDKSRRRYVATRGEGWRPTRRTRWSEREARRGVV
jgi:hypothetical protein